MLTDSTSGLFSAGECDCPVGAMNCVSNVTKSLSRCTELELLNGEYELLITSRKNAIILKALA